jgi:hypothetical protein
MALLHHTLISYYYSFSDQFYEHTNKVVVESPFSPIIMALYSPGFKEKTL